MSAKGERPFALSRQEARELDRRAIEEFGIPACVLMENAGRACVQELVGWSELREGECLVVCGCGNNGGDGLVIARTLYNLGWPVRVILLGTEERMQAASEEVQRNLRLWRGLGGDLVFVGAGMDMQTLTEDFRAAGVLVDAIFGTGLTRRVEQIFATVIESMNVSGRPILAVDMPSGIDADTGQVLGVAIRATCTLAFVAPKLGQGLAPGRDFCGRIETVEIGIPRHFPAF